MIELIPLRGRLSLPKWYMRKLGLPLLVVQRLSVENSQKKLQKHVRTLYELYGHS